MRLDRTFAAIIAASVATAASAADPAPVGQRIEAALAALRPTVQVSGRAYAARSLAEVMREHRVPAVSIAVIEDGRIAWSGAFGAAEVESARPATTDTLFQAASISKPVAATAALALVDQNVLALDRPVNEQLVSWRIPDNDLTRAAPVTLRHLLTHTGGLTVHGFPGYAPSAAMPTVVQILDGQPPANTAAVRVDQRPGTGWRYSGGGYTIAQLLMADVARESFDTLADRLVLRPAGMLRSSFRPLEGARRAEAAHGYRRDGRRVEGGYHVYPEMAAAALWTTPEDLARWALAISAAFRGEAETPIRAETARAMLTPGQGDWGLGMNVQGEGEWLRFSHGGANEGFRATLVMFPRRGDGIVIMTNGDDGAPVMGSILQAVGRARGWPDSAPRMIEAVAVSRQSLEDVVGRYASGEVSVEINLDGDRVMVSLPGGRSEIVPRGNDAFFVLNAGFEMRFLRDPATGRVVSVSGAGRTLARIP